MKMLYGFILINCMFMNYASENNKYVPQGKIPDNFEFKKCAEDDEDCKNKRDSFMSQFKSYSSHNAGMIEIISNVELNINESRENDNLVINIQDVSNKKCK